MPDSLAALPSEAPVAILGGGPVGLAAAAHLVLRGLRPLVIEAGPEVGHAARAWGHVRMFSPWSFNIDAAARALLATVGWSAPSGGDYPTGDDLVDRYLAPLSRVAPLRDAVLRDTRIVGVARHHHDRMRDGSRGEAPFVLHVAGTSGPIREIPAAAVIDCTGCWGRPNPAGAHGLPALGELACGHRIAYGIPDVAGGERRHYAGRVTLVVGSGHSAVNAVLGLLGLARTEPGTRIVWALRKPVAELQFGAGVADTLEQRRALGQRAQSILDHGAVEALAPFWIERIAQPAGGPLLVTGVHGDRGRTVEADRMIVATGFRPDLSFLRELRLTFDPALEAPSGVASIIDPRLHSCCGVPGHGEAALRHPEPNFYVAGMKSYGRTPTFLLAMGYEQVRSIAASLAGDHAAAAANRLEAAASAACSCAPSGDAAAACCAPKLPGPSGREGDPVGLGTRVARPLPTPA